MQEIKDTKEFLAQNPQGIILTLPTEKMREIVALTHKFEYNGMLFQEGTLCQMRIFGELSEVVLFFDKSSEMLLYYDSHTNHTFNILGYVACVESVYNDDFTLAFGSKKKESICQTGSHNTYILRFVNGTELAFSVKLESDRIGDKDTIICDIQFTSVQYRNEFGQLLIKPAIDMQQKSLIQKDCESLFI